MGFIFGIFMEKVKIDKVFFGFCINGCIEDMCFVVCVIFVFQKNGGFFKVVDGVYVMIVFGFGLVK